MAKDYWFEFGSGDPQIYTGMAATFLYFYDSAGVTISPPGITELISGSGAYLFSYGPTISTKFLIDGGASIVTATDRYVSGVLDPVQAVDQTANTINSSIGSTGDSFGSTAMDPGTIFGYVKRLQENLEGNEVYTKNTGVFDIYSRGSSTLLIEKTVVNSTNTVTKT